MTFPHMIHLTDAEKAAIYAKARRERSLAYAAAFRALGVAVRKLFAPRDGIHGAGGRPLGLAG